MSDRIEDLKKEVKAWKDASEQWQTAAYANRDWAEDCFTRAFFKGTFTGCLVCGFWFMVWWILR